MAGKYRTKEFVSMELITVKELYKNREQYFDKEVTVGGWVRSNRDSKTFGFLVVNDGSFFEPLQVVYSDTLADFAKIAKIAINIIGIIMEYKCSPKINTNCNIKCMNVLPLKLLICHQFISKK